MPSSVLRSPRAVRVNVEIMRAFVKLRQMLASNELLARRLDELESRYDGQFRTVFDAIRALMDPPDEDPATARPPIGFRHTPPESQRARPKRTKPASRTRTR
jgi:hypothetical protein